MLILAEIALAAFLVADLALTGAARLKSAVRIVATQGWIVGILPLLLADPATPIPARTWLLCAVNIAIKGVILPLLVDYAAKRANTSRELEPILSFRASQFVFFLLAAGSFAIGKSMHVSGAVASELAIPAALATMGAGLLLICTRKKAITQVLGFITLENGISLFGAGILLEYDTIVELGILLDVFALIFILGIAVFQISRTFASTDTDRLNRLGDTHLLHMRKRPRAR